MSTDILVVFKKSLAYGQFPVSEPVHLYYEQFDKQSFAQADLHNLTPVKKISSSGNYRHTISWLNDFNACKMENETIFDLTRTKNRLIGWPFIIEYIWPYLFQCIEMITISKQLIKSTSPIKVVLIPPVDRSATIFASIVKNAAEHYKIEFEIFRKPTSFRGYLSKLKYFLVHNLVTRQAFILIFKLAVKFISLFGHTDKSASKKKKLVFTSLTRDWMPIRKADGSLEYVDGQSSAILDQLNKSSWSISGIECPYDTSFRALKKLFQRTRYSRKQLLPYQNYYTFITLFPPIIGTIYECRSLLKQFNGSALVQQKLTYQEIDMRNALAEIFTYMFNTVLPDCISYYQAAKEIIKQEHPSVIVNTYETGPFQRALMVAAKEVNIPVVGMQHGMIFGNHYDYMHKQLTLSPAESGILIADKTLVWGKFWERNLVEIGRYPNSAVSIVGNWKYDHFNKQSNPFDKNRILKELLIKPTPEQQIVLILTTGFHSTDYVDNVLTQLKKLPNIFPIVKPHPIDIGLPLDLLLAEHGYTAQQRVIGNIRDWILTADIVITQCSTTIIESVFMDKPTVVAHFVEFEGWEEIRNATFCHHIETPQELNPLIRKIQNNKQSLNTFDRTQFIKDFFYKDDAHSAQRAANVITKLAEKNKPQ